jgi:RNA polymerase sigma factor (sigma-70 family)
MRDTREKVKKHPVAQLIGFMNTVARNIIIDDARKQERQPMLESMDETIGDGNGGDGTLLVDTIADVTTDVAEKATENVSRVRLRQVVRQTFAELSQQQQAIIHLDAGSEWTLKDEEIADILRDRYKKVTANTVRNQRHRAMGKLKESIQAWRESDEDVDELLKSFLSRWRDD